MTNEVSNNPQIPVSADSTSKETTRRQQTILIVVIALAVLFLAGIIVAVWALLQPGTPTERIRDIFIILMAFESLVIGAALIILIVQVASLINLLQNEVRPILEATNETVHTLRGTTAFLSENVVAPVIKLNGYMAGLQRMLELIGMKRK
jgi:ABC-type dipeptide/oligopeptide/nickel transport system permease component